MSLRWDWNQCIGELEIEDQAKARLMVYQGNALMIILNEWKNEAGETLWSMYNFLADKDHFKNCKADKSFNYAQGWKKLTLWELPKNLWDLIQDLHKRGVEIEIRSKR